MTFPAPSIFAASRNGMSYLAGVVTGMVVIIVWHGTNADQINKLVDNINQIALAIGGVAAALAAARNGIKAWYSATPEAQEAAVASRPDRMVVKIDPADAASAAASAAALPQVKQVVTSPEIAKAIPDDKVVGPQT